MQQIEAVKEPERQFRMDEVTLSMPKWGAACDWGTRDDAMLLLGCYWYATTYQHSLFSLPMPLRSSSRMLAATLKVDSSASDQPFLAASS